jgi:hypothetical protein
VFLLVLFCESVSIHHIPSQNRNVA